MVYQAFCKVVLARWLVVCCISLASLQAQTVVSNRVLTLNGWPDYVSLSQPLPDLTNCTIEAWVYYTGGANRGFILADNTQGSGEDFEIFVTESVIGIRADKNGGELVVIFGVPNLGNQWHHLAWILAPNSSTLMVDGVPIAQASQSGSNIGSHAAQPRIGGWWDNYDWEPGTEGYDWIRAWGFVGRMDELRIWDVARHPSEITSNMYRRLTGNESGLIGYYHFDNGAATDSSPRQNHGILNGNAATPLLELPARLDIQMFPTMALHGWVGSPYRVEYLDAFRPTNQWLTLTNITISENPAVFTDPIPPVQSQRFYRAVLAPAQQ